MPATSDLKRFIDAQEKTYSTALTEIKRGRKQSHWMWFIFPQIAGLGFSEISIRYGIRDLDEAVDYLNHPVLGSRLIEICEALMAGSENDAHQIFGSPDDMKLKSCMTLFSCVPGAPGVFEDVLKRFFGDLPDEKTVRLIHG
jgi:uncharacterized protein (DUF1810 family)